MMWKLLLLAAAACLQYAVATSPVIVESSCTDANATSGCGINCGKHCSNIFNPPANKSAPVICHALCRQGGCDCIDGYYADDKQGGICVLPEDCVKPSCPKNEVYEMCRTNCPPRTCASRNIQVKCIAPPTYPDDRCLPPGCRCEAGFYRNSDGNCVTKEQCEMDCPENEEYDPCPSDCPPRECKYKDIFISCIAQPQPGDPKCKPGKCRCKNEFLRNDEGNCVAREDCPATSRKRRDTTTDTEETCGSNDQESPDLTDSSDSSSNNSNDSSDLSNTDTNTSTTNDSSNSNDSSNTDSNGSGSSTDTEQALQKFNNGNAVFTGKFYSKVSKDNSGKSTIMSPYSLLFLLGELALYADGDSYNELMTSLGLTSKDEIRNVFPRLLDNIESVKNVTFNLASKTYSNQNYPLSDNFKKDTKVVFRAEAQELDMSKPSEAAGIVNTWVANKTNDKIKDILSPDAISTDTRIILANALYFKGRWLEQFNKNLTTDQDFTTEDNKVTKVPTMYREAKYRYGYSQELDCEALEMKYENQDFSLIIYLPSKVGGLAALQEKMKDSQVVQKFRNSLSSQTVRIYIPRFKIETTIDLVALLKSIGITKIFQSGNSGLSGMLAKPEDIFVSSGVQKAFVEVNEEGAEAAAANVLVISRTTSVVIKPEPLYFRANHGFVYEILSGNTTAFLGTYAGN